MQAKDTSDGASRAENSRTLETLRPGREFARAVLLVCVIDVLHTERRKESKHREAGLIKEKY